MLDALKEEVGMAEVLRLVGEVIMLRMEERQAGNLVAYARFVQF